MKRAIANALLGIMTANAVMAATPRKWTLKDCIDYAMANNITLQQSRIAKQSAIEDVKQAKSELLPSLDFSTNHSAGYRPWVNSGVSTVANGTVETSINKTYYNGSYGINASWTVWNGNRNRNNLKLNRLAAEQAELDSAETANNIQEQIAQIYIQILYLNEAIAANKQSYEASRKHEEQGIAMLNLGKMSKADVAQLKAQSAQDRYNIVETESSLAQYKLQLKQLLEITDNEDFDVKVPQASDENALSEIPSLASVYEAALEQRPEIRNSQLAVQSSDVNIAVAKAGRMPSLSLSGSVGTSTTSMNSKKWGSQMQTNFDATIGATLSIPILDNRSTKTAVNKAKLQKEQNVLSLKDKQKQLYSTIEGYWLDANTNQQKFKAAKASMESERESYELLSEQFKLGLKNIVELMNGKANLMNATQDMLQSKYMTILDQQLLRFYKGEQLNI